MLNDWISNNIEELKKICSRITRGQDSEDLLQFSIEQFLNNKKVPNIPDKEKLYFFTRIVRNNYNSKSSPYYHLYKKFQFLEIENIEIPYLELEEDVITLDWVYNELKKLDLFFKQIKKKI